MSREGRGRWELDIHSGRPLSCRYPGLRVRDRASLTTASDADRETNRWLGPLFVAIIFAFTSIAAITHSHSYLLFYFILLPLTLNLSHTKKPT